MNDNNFFLELQNHNLHNKVAQLNTIIRRQKKQLTDVQDALEIRNNEIKNLKTKNIKLYEYALALSMCQKYACLCEFCPFKYEDPDGDETMFNCVFNFEKLKNAAGMEE